MTSTTQHIGDVKLVSSVGGRTMYDTADHLVLIASGSYVQKLDGSFTAINLPDTITALAYNSSAHLILLSDGTSIYESTVTGPVKKIASGFSNIFAMTVDSLGRLYVIDTDHISTVVSGRPHAVTAPGTVGTYVGQTAAYPHIAYDSHAALLVYTDPVNHEIKVANPVTGAVRLLAGRCVAVMNGGAASCAYGNRAGTGAGALFGQPCGIAFNPSNDTIYFTDEWNNDLWSITESGAAVQIAGFGAVGNRDANGLAALLNAPCDVAYDPDNGQLDFFEYDYNTGTTSSYVTATYATTGNAAPSFVTPTVRFDVPEIPGSPFDIDTASDGTVWGIDPNNAIVLHAGSAGILAHYSLPKSYGFVNIGGMAVDSLGNAWTAAQYPMVQTYMALIRITPSGAVNVFTVPDSLGYDKHIAALTHGPDGNIWFTVADSNGGYVGLIRATTGALTMYRTVHAQNGPQPGAVAPGPDGNMWYSYSDSAGNSFVGRISTAGKYLTAIPIGQYGVAWMRANPVDHSMWFADGLHYVGSISLQGVQHAYWLGCRSCLQPTEGWPVRLTVDHSGYVWASEENFGDIARLDSSGRILRYMIPQAVAGPVGIAARSDGRLWYAAFGAFYLFSPTQYSADGLPNV